MKKLSWFQSLLLLIRELQKKDQDKPKPEPVDVPVPDPVVDPTPVQPEKSLRFHHWNPKSWEGRGSSVVFCRGQRRFDSVTIDGVKMVRHGAQDKGRDVWTVYNRKGLGGKLVAKRDDDVFSATVGHHQMQYGEC